MNDPSRAHVQMILYGLVVKWLARGIEKKSKNDLFEKKVMIVTQVKSIEKSPRLFYSRMAIRGVLRCWRDA